MLIKLNYITKYFGFLVPVIGWGSIGLMMALQPIDLSEPVSQFGYYESTRVIFGLTLTAGALLWYLFSRHLDRYWEKTSLVTLIASFFYTVVAWVPYEPYVREFIFDVHNVTIVLAATLYSMPMVFIAYKKKHEKISRISAILFIATFVLITISLFARFLGYGILYAQLAALLPTTIWLVMVNTLVLEDEDEANSRLTSEL